MIKIETVFDVILKHGEGPVWDVANNRLYWVDLFAGDIYSGDPTTGKFEKKNLGQPVGVVALRENGGFVFAAHEGFGFTDISPDSPVTFFSNPQPYFPLTRFNDGKVDPLGNFVAGTMTFNGMKPFGNLFQLGPDQMVQGIERSLMLSNGMDWSPCGTIFYLADTNNRVVYAYDYNLADGSISNRKNFIEFDEHEFPDGLCVDEAGNLWIAIWGGGMILQFDNCGKRCNKIELPVTHPTSCWFGGEGLSTLFITSSQHSLTDMQKQQQPLAGKIFTIQPDCKGQAMRRYAG